MLIGQALSPIAVRNGANIAFRYLKLRVTYKDYWETSARFSYYLQKEIGHGLRVGLWMSNTPQFMYCFLALANTKSCSVPLNPWATPDENLFKIKNSKLTVVLTTSDHFKSVSEMLHQNGLGSIKVIDMENKRCAEYDKSYTPPANHVPNEKDQILLFYTPGSTGKYKGCLFSHNSIASAMNAVKASYKVLPTDVFYTQRSYSRMFDFMHFLLMPLATGAGILISDQVDPAEVIKLMNEHRVTRMAPNVATFPELLKASEELKMPIATLKTISLGASTLTTEGWELIKKQGKINVIQTYGMTEYLGTIANSTPDVYGDPKKPQLIGPPLVGTKVRVVDDKSDEIDKKKPQKGQLLVMGSCLMDKYLDLPEDQKMTVRGTWLFTGDIVEVDKEGRINFIERKADVVTLQEGKKIYPKEVEPVVYQIPQVQECAYIGVRNTMKKAMSGLVIVVKDKMKLTEKEVRDFLAAKIAPDKMPYGVYFVETMPRTISGAINRAKLRSQYDGV